MEYRQLGRSGMTVSRVALGAMMFGAIGNPDREDCVRIVHRALHAGITSINTADGYSAGQSEEILGQALTAGRRDPVVLLAKTGRKTGTCDLFSCALVARHRLGQMDAYAYGSGRSASVK